MLRRILSSFDPGIAELEAFASELNGRWVVIFAGSFPDGGDAAVDGYAQRVRAIDELLQPFRRIYVDTTGRTETAVRRLGDDVVLLSIGKSRGRERACARIAARAGCVYIHSLLGGSARLLARVLAINGIAKIWDVHGAVPEECAYRGADSLARKMERLEILAALRSTGIVCVSEAMERHLQAKHGQGAAIILQLPAISGMTAPAPSDRNGRNFVYAGSIDTWQEFAPMAEAITRSRIDGNFTLFVPDPIAARQVFPAALGPRIVIATDTPQGVRRRLAEFAYGFCLREDLVLNRVACPTKLVDYVAAGVVPILSFAGIGDFEKLGLQSVRLADFVAGRLPTDAKRLNMARENHLILGELNRRYVANAARLVSHVTGASAGLAD
jgi:hypothetical protein